MGAVTLFRLNPQKLMRQNVIRPGTKTVTATVAGKTTSLEVPTYFYRGEPEPFAAEPPPFEDELPEPARYRRISGPATVSPFRSANPYG